MALSRTVRISEMRDGPKKTFEHGNAASSKKTRWTQTLDISHGRHVRPGISEATKCTR